MENATKALLIAGSVLISILIISLLVMIFNNTGNVSRTYNDRIESEDITKFNSNFTKYLGQDLTIHEVITITNFALNNGVTVNNGKSTADINDSSLKEKYSITIPENAYGSDGYIKEVTIMKK